MTSRIEFAAIPDILKRTGKPVRYYLVYGDGIRTWERKPGGIILDGPSISGRCKPGTEARFLNYWEAWAFFCKSQL